MLVIKEFLKLSSAKTASFTNKNSQNLFFIDLTTKHESQMLKQKERGRVKMYIVAPTLQSNHFTINIKFISNSPRIFFFALVQKHFSTEFSLPPVTVHDDDKASWERIEILLSTLWWQWRLFKGKNANFHLRCVYAYMTLYQRR